MDMQQLPDVRVTAPKVKENGFLREFLSEDATASIPCVLQDITWLCILEPYKPLKIRP